MPASGVVFGLAASNVGIDAIFTIVPSLIACVVVCTQDRPCVSVFYQEETHKCYLSSTVYRPTSPELLSVPGMQHYHSDRCPPGSTIMTSDFVCVTVYAWNLGKIAADGKCRKYSFAGNNYRLITFKTKSKYDELTQYLDSVSKNITGTWTGLIYGIRSAKWTWQDGSYALYLPWDRNEPSRPRVEQCTLLIRRFNWKMHDYTCKRARSVACEVSANI